MNYAESSDELFEVIEEIKSGKCCNNCINKGFECHNEEHYDMVMVDKETVYCSDYKPITEEELIINDSYLVHWFKVEIVNQIKKHDQLHNSPNPEVKRYDNLYRKLNAILDNHFGGG